MTDLPIVTPSATTPILQSQSVLISMDIDGGNIRIDWAEVERQAKGHDGYLMPLAKALLFIRDKNCQAASPVAPEVKP
jgi:hypothetical protein